VKRFADILGQEDAVLFLRRAARSERLAHALLFTGPEGIGKRSVALAFAAWQQCTEGGDDSCGECSGCRQVAAGSHPDVKMVEVEAGKKEIGVERARELKRFTQLAPSAGKLKIAIIDDAHRLTVAAQNGLLKTLEDPPARSVLILVSNNPDVLLATVRSRCQRFAFHPLAAADVAAVLVASLGLLAGDATRLAAVCEGSPRRAMDLRASLDVGGSLLDAVRQATHARFVDLDPLAKRFGEPEAEIGAKLEMLLAEIRDAATAMVRDGATGDDHLHRLLRQAELVRVASDTLRRTNPNRQLLLDALLIRLTSTAG